MSRSTERRKKKKCNKGNKLSMDKVLMNEAREFLKKYKNDTTRKAYEKNYKKYIDFCRRNFNAKSKDDCGKHIQEYAFSLISQGKSASTVHTYLAPVCIYHGVSMKDIEKPIRHIAENKRSRSRENKYKRADQQYNNPQYNLAAGSTVTEIEVFEVRLKTNILDEAVLRQIDKEIPYHIVFLLEYDGKYQAWTAYKEASTGNTAFKVNHYYHTDWMAEDVLPLKLDGLNVDAVYENFVYQIAGDTLQAAEHESLQDAVERDEKVKNLKKQIEVLQARIRKEKQLNVQMKLNTELKKLKKELEVLQ